MKRSYPKTTVAFWCALFGYSRQSYYQSLQAQERTILQQEFILQLVVDYRARGLPRLGSRKLYHVLKEDLRRAGIAMGRDQLHRLLVANGLIVKRKQRATRTTLSQAWYHKWPDHRQGLAVLASELLWCADITYLRLVDGFAYLSLITDEYSRTIVGWCCHDSLHTVGCLSALDMALQQRRYPDRKLIHHSDRGCQHCSEAYTDRLVTQFIDVSATQSGSPYDNPLAESVNGQLKVELGLDATFADLASARWACQKALTVYNEVRPHGSLDYLTPHQAYPMQGALTKRWTKAGTVDLTTRSRTAAQAVKLYQDETNWVSYPPDSIY